MTLEQILPLYKMDKAELRSDRRYYEHTEPLTDTEHDLRLAEMPVFATYDETNWVDALPDELAQKLVNRPMHGCAHSITIVCADIRSLKTSSFCLFRSVRFLVTLAESKKMRT